MKKKIDQMMATLSGVVIPSSWDEENEVVAVSLATNDERKYLIENGAKFFKIMNKQIRAEGFVKKLRRAHRTIKIMKYELLEN
jgi:hypothetical protein